MKIFCDISVNLTLFLYDFMLLSSPFFKKLLSSQLAITFPVFSKLFDYFYLKCKEMRKITKSKDTNAILEVETLVRLRQKRRKSGGNRIK